MKKVLVMFIALVVLFAMVSCKDEPHVHSWDEGTDNGNGKYVYKCSGCDETKSEYMTFEIGDEGPGGGFVFYDCDADNTQEDPDGADNLKSSVCGWRYLEISSTILDTATHVNCYSTKDPNDPASFDDSPSHFLIPDPLVTGAAIGDGKANTETFYGLFTQGYLYSPNWQSAVAKQTAQNSVFALVKASQEGGKSDWFIPSVGELIAANSAGFTFEMPNFGIWSSTRMTNENTNRTMKNGASSTDNQGPNSRWYKIRQF